MIDPVFVSEQLARLGNLRWFPKREDLEAERRELCTAAATAATTEILERVITDWIREHRDCPKPADLYRMIADEKERHKSEPVGKSQTQVAQCPICEDDGIAESINERDLNSVASYCICAAGRRRTTQSHDEYSPDQINAVRAKLRDVESQRKKKRSTDRTSRDLMTKRTTERLRAVVEIEPEQPIHIPATPVRTPEEREKLEAETREHLDDYHGEF